MSKNTEKEPPAGIVVPEDFTPVSEDGRGLVETLLDEQNYAVIKSYMNSRFGMLDSETRNKLGVPGVYSKEDVVDSFVNQMRRFNSGQSVVTLGELAYLNSGDEKQLNRKRKTAQDAYKLFDSMSGAFSKDRTLGEKADAVYDYARAMIVDPVNLVSLGVGSLTKKAATKKLGVTEKIKKLAFRVGRQAATKELAKSGSKKAAMQVQKEVTQRAFQKAMERTKTKALVSKADTASVVGAMGFDMIAAGGMDFVQQKAEVISDFKEDVNFFQTGLSTFTGALGGVTQFGLIKLQNRKRIPLASIQLERSRSVMRAREEVAASLNKNILESEEVGQQLIELKRRTSLWAEKVAEGKRLAKASDDPKTSIDYDTNFAHMFFNGSNQLGLEEIDGSLEFKGLSTILANAGYRQPDDMNFTDFMYEAVTNMSDENRKHVEDAYKILRESSDQLKDFNLTDFLNIDAAAVSKAGQVMQVKSNAKQIFNKLGLDIDKTDAAKAVKVLTDAIDKETKDSFFKRGATKIGDFQQSLVTNIVTHPGTTALNLIGWKSATTYQSISDMLRAPLYSGAALANLVKGNRVNAIKYKNLAVSMMDLQRTKLANLVDPYGTYDSVMDYLAIRTDAQKEMFRYINGGVEVKGVLDEFELNPNNVPKKGFIEKFDNVFQTAYGVKAQDFLTKSQEFIYALDKEIRIKYGKTYHEFLNDPELVKFLSEKGTDTFKEFAELEARAVDQALRNTFSKKIGDPRGDITQKLANVIEGARRVPIIGAYLPFGQFFNNSVSFLLDHSGFSLLNKYVDISTGRGLGKIAEKDILDLHTKMAVGWGAVALSVPAAKQGLEEGLAWYESRDETGAVRNYLYDYPRNVPMLFGRWFAEMQRGDGILPDTELIAAASELFGAKSLTGDLGEAYGLVTRALMAAADKQDIEYYDLANRWIGDIISQYTSGFTRKFDPINQALGLNRGEDYVVVDRKEGNQTLNDSLRYLDQIEAVLSPALGISEEQRKSFGIATTEKERLLTREPGQVPIGRIFGYREVLPSTTIEKLFNDVNRPNWKTDLRSKVPEALNLYSKIMRPRLEVLAEELLDSGEWDSADEQTRKEMLNDILIGAKKSAMNALKRSSDPDDKKAEIIFSIKSGISKKNFQRALEYFGIPEKDMWKLDLNQLQLLESFAKDYQEEKIESRKKRGMD
tara:strand:+ start:1035 stop:4583 length:3549 start_codon:yes stop_codon:yes gene_type:complete